MKVVKTAADDAEASKDDLDESGRPKLKKKSLWGKKAKQPAAKPGAGAGGKPGTVSWPTFEAFLRAYGGDSKDRLHAFRERRRSEFAEKKAARRAEKEERERAHKTTLDYESELQRQFQVCSVAASSLSLCSVVTASLSLCSV